MELVNYKKEDMENVVNTSFYTHMYGYEVTKMDYPGTSLAPYANITMRQLDTLLNNK